MKHNNKVTGGTKMKSVVFFGIVYLLLLPLLAIGCDKGGDVKTVEITLDQFAAENNQSVNIELKKDATLIVRLGSNPTTGYQWEDAEVTGSDMISQTDRQTVAPTDTEAMGAPSTEVWTFAAHKAGTASIAFSYGRPWEGGEKGTYTLKINVTVK